MLGTLARTTARNLLLPVAFALAAFIPAITHDAPLGDYQKIRGEVASMMFIESRGLDQPTNVPEWSWVAEDFPSCSPRTDVLAEDVVVVDSGADSHRMDFDRAWALNHDNERANDVWVVGTC